MYVEMRAGRRLCYEIEGEGYPIILVHSYLWDKDMWKPQREELSKKYKCISIDLWAHGGSDILDDVKEYSMESLAKDVIAFADKLGIGQFIYAGLSVGGMIGTHLALKYPDRLKASIIMDGYSGAEPQETKALYFGMLDMIENIKQIPEQLADQIAPIFFSKQENINKGELYTKLKRSLLNISEDRLQSVVALGRGIFGRNSILEEMKGISIPVCFIVGDEDIPRPVSESQEMAALVKDSSLYIIPKAGHISTLENPEEVNRALNDFLEKL